MGYKQQSLQLIATDEHNKFYLTAQGRQFLLSLSKPLSVISIAGVYRTGKSYLVNRLIKTKTAGFRTGGTTQSVTKGLSIWGRPISSADEQGKQIEYIVIDSEGIGSCQQEVKYDLKILTLVFLISSTVIYNSMGAIDELALDQLRVVTNLKKCLNSQSEAEKTKLVWVLRDFALQLADRHGTEISPNQYLEHCLEEVPGNNLETKKKNQIRKAIKDNLGEKVCYTLVRPTINEDELANLQRCKLRTEFVSQIQCIREQIFRGSISDVKKINGHSLNGKLLADLLEECIAVLNDNGLPQLTTIWDAVKSLAYQQFFDSLSSRLKFEISKIQLPLSKEQLRLKLNEIENKYYLQLQKEYQDGDSFKKYHRQFLKMLQKVNREVKKNNEKNLRDKVVRQLRQFVRENIVISSIEPTNLTLVKTIIDRMELKTKGQPQGYEYVLSVLMDLMHISEQKAIGMQKQLSQYKKIAQLNSAERKSIDLNTLALKKDYHEALKTISNLKMTQEENEKENGLLKLQLEAQKTKLQSNLVESETRQSKLIRQLQQANLKNRQKGEEVSASLKRLRQQNSELLCELSNMRQQRLKESLAEKKQLIFQEKMRQAWDRFDEERKSMKAQTSNLRRDVQLWMQKYEQEFKLHERETELHIKEKESFGRKQREFMDQIKQIKALHAQAKKTYTATFDTMKDNDRIIRSIQNSAMSSSKLASCRKPVQQDKDANGARKYYQDPLVKMKTSYQQQIQQMQGQMTNLKKTCQQLRLQVTQGDLQLKQMIVERERLEQELAMVGEKFAQTVSEIQSAKQRQRSLYEQSIVRLLNNLDRRQSYQSSHRR